MKNNFLITNDISSLLKLKENGGSTATSTVQVGEETNAVFVMVMNGEQVKAVVADLATGLKIEVL